MAPPSTPTAAKIAFSMTTPRVYMKRLAPKDMPHFANLRQQEVEPFTLRERVTLFALGAAFIGVIYFAVYLCNLPVAA